MENGLALQELLKELELIPLLAQRPVIQLQLVAFVVVLVVAWLLSAAGWKFFLRGWLTMTRRRTQGRRRHLMGYVKLAVRFLLYPALGLLLLNLAIMVFRESGRLEAVLVELSTFFWLLAGYRLVLIL
jgi:hypothetical protein